MRAGSREIRKHDGVFRYEDKNIPFNFWTNSDTKPIETVLFLGAGQIKNIPRWVAEAAPAGVAVVEGAPHWRAHPSGRDIYEFMGGYVQNAFFIVLDKFKLTSAHVIAESQAAPAAIMLAASHPGRIRNLALVRPLGFTTKTYGRTAQQRLKTFSLRVFRSSLQYVKWLRDPRNSLLALIVMRAMLSEPSLKALANKYAAGVSYDSLEDCRRAALQQQRKGASFTILMGEHDKVFPPNEIAAALKESGITSIKTKLIRKSFHTSLAVRDGTKTLDMAIDAVKR